MADQSKRVPTYSSSRAVLERPAQAVTSRSQRTIPLINDHVLASTISSHERCCPVRISQPTDSFLDRPQHASHHSPLPNAFNCNRKRSLEDDAYLAHLRPQLKRTRLECNTESENQPPPAAVKRRSLFWCHPRHDWSQWATPNEMPSFLNPLLPPMAVHHDYQQNLLSHLTPPMLHAEQLMNQQLHTFANQTAVEMGRKSTFPKPSATAGNDHLCLFSSPSNSASPLRTTNFVLDSNQQAMSATILRTGNISPAHSDTSTESASTCSSDEHQFRPYLPSLHYQPSRSYRERENYEHLLDLAEKLSDPSRLNAIDVEQFVSYRYKTKTTTTTELVSSKQTACVICMSPFKNNQRIRVLPCQHEYHSKCIAQWFAMNSSCPICRRDSDRSTC